MELKPLFSRKHGVKGTQSIHVTSMGRSVSRVLSSTPAYCGSHQAKF